MQEALIRYIRQRGLLRAGMRVGAAVSGGADSVALLRLLLEARDVLGVVLSVVHFNHKLRAAESDADEAFVRELASRHELEFFCRAGDTRAYAAERKCGIEAAARELRYGFFWELLSPQGSHRSVGEAKQGRLSIDDCRLDRIATAHTLEDQAETVVLRLVRGAGTRGLAGIYPILEAENHFRLPIDDCRLQELPVSGETPADLPAGSQRYGKVAKAGETPMTPSGAIVRPLLEFRRAQLRHYLKRAGQAWREDASNQDVAFARNRVRQEAMPKLRDLNPAVEMVLAETAEIARGEEEYWREVVKAALEKVTAEKQGQFSIDDCRLQEDSAETADGLRAQKNTVIDAARLMDAPLALRRRVVREFAEWCGLRLEFHHVEQVLEVASRGRSRSEKRVEVVEGWDVCVVENQLRLEKRSEKREQKDYELPLPVPGQVCADAAGVVLRARVTESGKRLKVRGLRVRNWRPGDRYWPAHTSSEKKIKELLQGRRVPAGVRAAWPVVVSEAGEIVWVPGFEYPEKWVTDSGEGVALEFELQG